MAKGKKTEVVNELKDTVRSGPRGSPITSVLREQLPQIFHSGGRERNGLLILGAMDPEAAVLRIHLISQVPQELLVLAEDFGGAADGECEGRRRHIRRRG